ncbi:MULTISPECIES: hypothetical protein [Pandoraea]|uniref:Uncharacterized protein n=2 Tax=Pandoraea TaxID=93217 RepID=A0A5E4XGQ0_9BURK|nr:MULTISPECIES: hypothetical protein [Pandoraea]VVE17780.1 hypothetical protein PCE31107_02986 [Pandoraea cepalis]VVE35589.1 hypothetical protein PTE31013_03907 [Pandoraea terrigena]
MNGKRFKTNIEYYVWHGEGECDNKTHDLREALHIRTDLIADGHKSVYITDNHDDEVDDNYIARLFVNVRLVSEKVGNSEDEGAAGLYKVNFGQAVQNDQTLCREELAEIALKVFHGHQGIEDLSDFEIEVVDVFGCAVEPGIDYEGFGEDDGDVEKITEPLTELHESKGPDSLLTKLGNLRFANQSLTTALSEVAACLDGLGRAITFDSVHGNEVDWVTRARYVVEVALGRRVAYPDIDTVGEWVGLHYHRNFDAEPIEKRAEWVGRYMESHQ